MSAQFPNELARSITNKLMSLVVAEIQTAEMQKSIKDHIVQPVIHLLYKELYPYIISVSIVIVMILMFSIMTFVLFFLYHFKTR